MDLPSFRVRRSANAEHADNSVANFADCRVDPIAHRMKKIEVGLSERK